MAITIIAAVRRSSARTLPSKARAEASVIAADRLLTVEASVARHSNRNRLASASANCRPTSRRRATRRPFRRMPARAHPGARRDDQQSRRILRRAGPSGHRAGALTHAPLRAARRPMLRPAGPWEGRAWLPAWGPGSRKPLRDRCEIGFHPAQPDRRLLCLPGAERSDASRRETLRREVERIPPSSRSRAGSRRGMATRRAPRAIVAAKTGMVSDGLGKSSVRAAAGAPCPRSAPGLSSGSPASPRLRNLQISRVVDRRAQQVDRHDIDAETSKPAQEIQLAGEPLQHQVSTTEIKHDVVPLGELRLDKTGDPCPHVAVVGGGSGSRHAGSSARGFGSSDRRRR